MDQNRLFFAVWETKEYNQGPRLNYPGRVALSYLRPRLELLEGILVHVQEKHEGSIAAVMRMAQP